MKDQKPEVRFIFEKDEKEFKRMIKLAEQEGYTCVKPPVIRPGMYRQDMVLTEKLKH